MILGSDHRVVVRHNHLVSSNDGADRGACGESNILYFVSNHF